MADDLRQTIADEVSGFPVGDGYYGTTIAAGSEAYELADLILPIVAEEVRKAKAEAWDEGWDHRDTPDGYAWDGEQDVPLTSSPYDNPYRTTETGDGDEHR